MSLVFLDPWSPYPKKFETLRECNSASHCVCWSGGGGSNRRARSSGGPGRNNIVTGGFRWVLPIKLQGEGSIQSLGDWRVLICVQSSFINHKTAKDISWGVIAHKPWVVGRLSLATNRSLVSHAKWPSVIGHRQSRGPSMNVHKCYNTSANNSIIPCLPLTFLMWF